MEEDLENVPAINIWIWITIWNTDIYYCLKLLDIFSKPTTFDIALDTWC